jgi:branched-subunit amino acid transport protein
VNPWLAIVIGGLAVYSWKILGYMIPERILESPRVSRIASLMTVALLAALVGVQTFASKQGLTMDARLPAVVLAAVLAWRRVPFIVIVALAAGLTALLRAMHWMA